MGSMSDREFPELHYILAKNVRDARHIIGFSQQELAEKSALSTNFVAQIEQGRRFPSAVVLERLAESLGVRPYQLFYDGEVPDQVNREQAEKMGKWLLETLTGDMAKVIGQYVDELGKTKSQ